MGSYVKRTTLMVRDMERALVFYRDVLGAEIWFDTPFTLSGVGFPIGKAGDRLRLCIVRFEDPEIGMIGLIEFEDPPEAPPPVTYSLGWGQPIFVVVADDARAIHARAREHGFRLRNPEPHEWSTTGAKGETKHFVSTNLWDPDGHFFECNEVTHIEPAA